MTVLIHDLSFRTGNHAIGNQLSREQLRDYAAVAAGKAGVDILDTCARNCGAGPATRIWMLWSLSWSAWANGLGIDLYGLLDAADIAECELMDASPTIDSTGVVSGLPPCSSDSRSGYGGSSCEDVDPLDVFFEVSRLQAVAGQEDVILDVALALREENGSLDRRAERV